MMPQNAALSARRALPRREQDSPRAASWRLTSLPWLLVPFLSLGACVTSSPSLPGTALGDYSVVGTLGANTCGSGIGARNPWDFTASLAKDGSTLYLENQDGSDEVSGTLDATDDTSATLVSAVTANVDGSNASADPCYLTLATSFELKLDSATAPSSFTGKASYTYSVATSIASTTNCTSQLSSAGGKYATLPCTVEYSLKATRK
jgi:hypothetical protein